MQPDWAEWSLVMYALRLLAAAVVVMVTAGLAVLTGYGLFRWICRLKQPKEKGEA